MQSSGLGLISYSGAAASIALQRGGVRFGCEAVAVAREIAMDVRDDRGAFTDRGRNALLHLFRETYARFVIATIER